MGLLTKRAGPTCPTCGASDWSLTEHARVSHVDGAVRGTKVVTARTETKTDGPDISCDACGLFPPKGSVVWKKVLRAYLDG